jgi:hypothetical protein
MISVSISRASLGLTPLAIGDTSAGSVYTLMRDFNTGKVEADNTYAESRWQDGALLTSSRRKITEIAMLVRVTAGSVPGTVAAIAALADAIDQFDYEVTVQQQTYVNVYRCSPASWERVFDATQMRNGADLLHITIPRQP